MKFSVWPNAGQSWDDLATIARHADATGWHGIWIADHFMPMGGDLDQPVNECWTLLAGLAAVTERLRLGALVTGNTYRHPAVLAKQAVTVDHISGGNRLVLGLGAGWQENEHTAYGLEFNSFRWRFDRLEEACQIVNGLLTQPRTTVEGAHYTVVDAPLCPKPIGALPLMIGGTGEKRTMPIVARYAAEWNMWGTPALCGQKSAALAGVCEAEGRDPATVYHSAQAMVFVSHDTDQVATWQEQFAAAHNVIAGTPAELVDTMAAYVEAGVDEFIVPDFTFGGVSKALETYDLLKAEVIDQLA